MATVASPSPPARLLNSGPGSSHLPAKHPTFRVRCSAEGAQDTATAEEDTVVGTSKRSPSLLISAENVHKTRPITNADHYGGWGSQGAALAIRYQVPTAYEKKCEGLRNQELDEEEVRKQLELLKESYEILSSEEEIRIYDWSLSRSEKPDKYMRPFEVDITRTPTEPPPPQEPEDVGPTRLYFLLLSVHDLQQMSLLPFSM